VKWRSRQSPRQRSLTGKSYNRVNQRKAKHRAQGQGQAQAQAQARARASRHRQQVETQRGERRIRAAEE